MTMGTDKEVSTKPYLSSQKTRTGALTRTGAASKTENFQTTAVLPNPTGKNSNNNNNNKKP